MMWRARRKVIRTVNAGRAVARGPKATAKYAARRSVSRRLWR